MGEPRKRGCIGSAEAGHGIDERSVSQGATVLKNFYNTETPYHLRQSAHFLNLAIYEIKTAIEKMNKFEGEFKDESIDYLETLKGKLKQVLEQTERTEHLLMETWYDQEPPV